MKKENIKSFEILLPDGPFNYELVTCYKLDMEKGFTSTLPKKSLKDMAEVQKEETVQGWYLKRLITDKDLEIYAQAIEIYKADKKKTDDDWYQLPKKSKML